MADTAITLERFQQLVLECADHETGRVAFPQLRDWEAQVSWVMHMYSCGLIERTGPEKRQWEKAGPWIITDKGRAHLASMAAASIGASGKEKE